MLSRLVLGAVTAGAMIVPALAGMMNADEARKFVAGKVFAFTCFDGSRGAGRVLDDLGAAGSIQFSGSGPIRHVRLPGKNLCTGANDLVKVNFVSDFRQFCLVQIAGEAAPGKLSLG